jgi:hypothetical protein
MAVTEIGPPDRQAVLTNGTRVADWVTNPGYYSHPFYDSYDLWPHYSMQVPSTTLRLTFGTDGKLTTWRKVYR